MAYTVEFDLDGEIVYAPANLPGPDPRKLQGAMFLDRADLWPTKKPKPKKRRIPPPEQYHLPLDTEGD